VQQIVPSQRVTEGAGVHLNRAIGTRALPDLDPFLLLDEMRSRNPEDYVSGFPTHPHRGFETVSYMLSGSMEHRDSLGNRGLIGPGGTQWMTAGHGIVHSEMPRQTQGLLHGFQLWVNLPASHKMVAPRYQDLAPERIVELEHQDARVRLVAGALAGQRGPVQDIVTDPLFLDVRLEGRGRFSHEVPPAHTAFAYVIEGEVRFGEDGTRVPRGAVAVLAPGRDEVAARAEGPGRFLLIAGRPLREPIARWGPFVMNTDAEIQQAISDHRQGRLTML
jgi:hypothetical protein